MSWRFSIKEDTATASKCYSWGKNDRRTDVNSTVKDYKRRHEVLQGKRPAILTSRGIEGNKCQRQGIWDLPDTMGHGGIAIGRVAWCGGDPFRREILDKVLQMREVTYSENCNCLCMT